MPIVLLSVVLFALASPASAQTSATLVVLVQDQSGAALPEVAVALRHVATGATRSATTAGDGRAAVSDLAVGEYEVRATRDGFRPLVRSGLVLSVAA